MSKSEAATFGQLEDPSVTGHEANSQIWNILSKLQVLPPEEEAQYGALLTQLNGELDPVGKAETNLVGEIAWISFCKSRVRHAEIGTHFQALQKATDTLSSKIKSVLGLSHMREDVQIDVDEVERIIEIRPSTNLAELDDEILRISKSIAILDRDDSIDDEVFGLLSDPIMDMWPGEGVSDTDASGLKSYLMTQILPIFVRQRASIAARPLVRAVALGEALDQDKLMKLSRYERDLDRKRARLLRELQELQDRRRGATP